MLEIESSSTAEPAEATHRCEVVVTEAQPLVTASDRTFAVCYPLFVKTTVAVISLATLFWNVIFPPKVAISFLLTLANVEKYLAALFNSPAIQASHF